MRLRNWHALQLTNHRSNFFWRLTTQSNLYFQSTPLLRSRTPLLRNRLISCFGNQFNKQDDLRNYSVLTPKLSSIKSNILFMYNILQKKLSSLTSFKAQMFWQKSRIYTRGLTLNNAIIILSRLQPFFKIELIRQCFKSLLLNDYDLPVEQICKILKRLEFLTNQFNKILKRLEFLTNQFNKLKQVFRELKDRPQLYKNIIQQTGKRLSFQLTQKIFQANGKIMFFECCKQDCLPQIALHQISKLDDFSTLMKQRKIYNIRLQNRSKYDSTQDYLQKINYFLQDISVRIKMLQLGQRYLPSHFSKDDKKFLVLINNLQQLSNPLFKQEQRLHIFNKIRQIKNQHTSIIAFVENSQFVDNLILKANLKGKQFERQTVYIKKEDFEKSKSQLFSDEKIQSMILDSALAAQGKYDTANIKAKLLQFSGTLNCCSAVKQIQEILKSKFQSKQSLSQEIANRLQQDYKRSFRNNQRQLERKVFSGNRNELLKRIQLLLKIHYGQLLKQKWSSNKHIIQNLPQEQRQTYNYLCEHQVVFDLDFFKKDYQEIFIGLLNKNPQYLKALQSKDIKDKFSLSDENQQQLLLKSKIIQADKRKMSQTKGQCRKPAKIDEAEK